ncbi:protein-export membrane protein SecF [Pseudomonas sp. GM18]|uniref:protein translocase subunit SecF n=1 Tax=Pseudomonas sp. GM18 TaxID=1144324 RepID=UPI00027254ED|nr:protein translocase subunit SecF [Pseudomonas sp. GM18]EJM16943.1 protein-export membrane protein SecF [Pseudomonas sp. GM18]
MSLSSRRLSFILLTGLLACLVAATFSSLATHVRFGLEFRGGYEIYYVVNPAPGKTQLAKDDLLQTVAILSKRADSIGITEPDIRVEGANHIRVKLAGLTSAEESRSLLGSSQGLPTQLTEKYTQTVGSVLGKTALAETVQAGLIGIACIFLLLVGLYRTAGLIAAFCTLVYLWLLLIVFTASGATLSLSAVVVFVLGIGMAADASIICLERIREEIDLGRSLREAVENGFKGSLPTIRDANLVTALAMIALFAAGIGPIQGFALTMLVSIVISVATNFLLIRRLMLWLVDTQWVSQRWLIGKGKPRATKARRFNFVGLGKTAIVVSLLTIVSGSLYYRAHGLNLDIDFTAGTALDIDVDRAITQETATQIMTGAGTIPATVAVGGAQNQHIAVRFDEVLKPADLKQIITAFKGKYQTVEYEENTADPGVARDFATRAIYAVIAAFASIAIYIGLRFSWAIALATLLPIVQDILIVSAIFSLFKLEIDVTYIAALLTIIGYSLNDKIVIFGRIVENVKKSPPMDAAALWGLINLSISQTLGRSLYTVLTVVMASTCLYLFACEPLQMFSLALVLGLISGAVSSIFMSSAIWLTLSRRKHQVANVGSTLKVSAKRIPHLASTPFLGALLVVCMVGLGGWFWVPAQAMAGKTAVSASTSLGDLSSFRTITVDTARLVDAGDLKAAKARITDLETAWDQAEETLQPKSPASWTSLDKSIDRALSQLRSGKPDPKACADALKTLLAKLDSQQISAVTPVAAPSAGSMGDLSYLKVMITDTEKLLGSGDMKGARARITDLESTWDQNEEKLRAIDPEGWTSIDKSLDRALKQVRTGSPDLAACTEALSTLATKIDSKSVH